MASCQALYRNYVLTLVPYSEVTIPRLMSYNLHIVLYGFQPLFGCFGLHLYLVCNIFCINGYISQRQDSGSDSLVE